MGENTRVCVFTCAHDATDARVVEREAVSLREAGYDVTYYTPFEGDCPVPAVSYSDAATGEYPEMESRFRYAGRVLRVLLDTDYDVYHFHGPEALPVGLVLGAITGGKTVYDVHEDIEAVLRHKPIFPRPARPYLAKAAAVAERTLSRFVDGIVVASPDIAGRFRGHDDVAVVTNYPERRRAEETDVTGRGPDGTDGPVRFVYRGLLSENRGVVTMMDAIERVPTEHDVRFALGGRYASAELRERVRRRAASSDRIELVDWFATIDEMYEHYRNADVGTMCFHPDPNKTNAAHRSNKLFQYMAAGLPIVVSDIGNWAALVEDVGCGVAVDPEDPDAIAAAMTELATDPDRRASLGSNGREATLERFNWETQRERLVALYERLTDGEPTARLLDGPAVDADAI